MSSETRNCLFGNHSPTLPQLRAYNRCLIVHVGIDYLSKLYLKYGIYPTILSLCTTIQKALNSLFTQFHSYDNHFKFYILSCWFYQALIFYQTLI